MNEKPKIMAALAVIVKNHQVLVGKRNADRIYAGWWEFPGGKVEPGESAAAACKREAMEELGDRIQLGPQVMPEYARPHKYGLVHLTAFYARLETSHLDETADHDLVFVGPQELEQLRILPPSRPLVDYLVKHADEGPDY